MASLSLPDRDRAGWPFLRSGVMAKSNGHRKIEPKTSLPIGTLVPQPNGGALRNGNPGNKGGLGVIPKVARQRALESWYQRIPLAEQIADDPEEKSDTRLAAWDKLGKFGFGSEGSTIAAAQVETPEGYKFSLILGERGNPDD